MKVCGVTEGGWSKEEDICMMLQGRYSERFVALGSCFGAMSIHVGFDPGPGWGFLMSYKPTMQ